MRMRTRLVAGLAALALVAAACGDDDDDATSTEAPTETEAAEEEAAEEEEAVEEEAAEEEAAEEEVAEEEATTEEETEIPPRGDADLVFWLDETRATSLKPFVDGFAEETGLNVQIVELAYDDIRNAVNQAAPTGEGPDLFMGAHDWVGELVANGIVAPVDLGASEADYDPVAITAVTTDGALYGLPYALENVGLLRNTDLVPDAQATFEDLEATALALQEEGTISVPLAVQADGGDPYHNYPMYSSFGAVVFPIDEETGVYDTSVVGLDQPEGLEAGEGFGGWYESGLLSGDITYDIMISSFGSGDAPFAITGPWALAAIEEAGPDLNYVIEAVPPAGGVTSAPFTGVQTFYVSAFSENVALAQTFLLDYVNTEEAMLELYNADSRRPAHIPTLESLPEDPVLQGFAAAGEGGAPLPNIPEMGAVWQPWSDAYVLIAQGGDPTQAFTDAADQIRDAL